MQTHISPTRNSQQVLVLTHWGCSKCKYILQMLNVYKIPAKKHLIFLKVDLRTVICPTKNLQLFLILAHRSYSKCKDALIMFNVYKIDAKEHQAVCLWVADESNSLVNIVLEIFRICPPNIT